MAADLRSTTPPPPPPPSAEELSRYALPLRTLVARIGEVVVGQDQMIRGLVIGLLTNGHVLLEGVPGLAKTLTISTLAKAIDATFRRIQFTPDLLPADLTGTLIYSPRDGTFTPRRGPVFANFVLADEINRAPAKVQSALLESMQERQVTIGDETYALPDPFLVLATQNPIEQEGTYPLPEAQVDRFMLKLRVGYPDKRAERQILDRMATVHPPRPSQHVVTLRDIAQARELVDRVHIEDKVRDYIVDLVQATRDPGVYGIRIGNPSNGERASRTTGGRAAGATPSIPSNQAEKLIDFGASPRATISLAMAARANAFLDGRAYVTPHDVKTIAPDVLRHRIVVSYEAEAQEITSDTIAARILDSLPVP
ncbi:MAG TPA: AAA family ATPase [Phycisphaerales bacterium]|nr:AAA family ATPase [Phycisphaerales bacterium]